ncbi:MAG: DegT/DnrJ/EryC1/StrS family aminotransferase [Verrucomicrobia bacterium]|nr:DegT/DnrJ/EryC1/StrS family aminotransferase [Verrucomicrobiota bacterium]
MTVPFLNLRAAHDPLKGEIMAAIQQVIETSAFAGGSFVAKFDEEFAAYCHTKYSIGLGHGTEALWLPLLALGVGPGDEVITVPGTFMATAEAITYCGAKPVFIDIDESTYTMNPALLERAITPKTKAIIPVHLFGQVADMDPILEIANRHGIPIVEDACQAHGAEYKGRRAGSIGAAGAFSFYPGKNLGAMGEAGATTTNDAELKAKIETLRDHGQRKKYHHSMIGWNARMDGMQGAILSIKLKHLERGNECRRTNAALYQKLLAGEKNIIVPQEAPGRKHVYHLFAIRTPKRDAVIDALAKLSIHCGIHYPIPVHLEEAYQGLGLGRGSFPVAERCADEFISLPMFPELTADQIETVVRELKIAVRSING